MTLSATALFYTYKIKTFQETTLKRQIVDGYGGIYQIKIKLVFFANDRGVQIDGYAFDGCDKLSSVFFCGTQKDRKNVDSCDDSINCATWYYYSEEKPEEEGNYWHYVNGALTVW